MPPKSEPERIVAELEAGAVRGLFFLYETDVRRILDRAKGTG